MTRSGHSSWSARDSVDRSVRVRRRGKPALSAVYHGVALEQDLEKVGPNYFCTRIWIGVVPPEDSNGESSPGYACVVGELFDGDPTQRDRKRIVFDEGIALDPADFSPKERLCFGMRDDALQLPTLYTLRDAVIALKDLYWAERIFCPPGNPRFHQFIQSTDGLYAYDPRYGDGRYQKHMPFFVSRRRLCSGVLQVEHEERAHNLKLVDSLLALDLIEIRSHCKLFWERKLPTAYRAVGLVCAEMQMSDMTYRIRQMHFSDGYEDYGEDNQEMRSRALEAAEDLSHWATGNERMGGSGWLA